jgi:hypothetical protein
MTSTAVLTDDSTTIVAQEESPFRWGVVIAGAFAATATTFFLLTLGAAIGLALVPAAHAKPTVFFNLGAIYFLASQAFGFAVGGYLVGRLIGPEDENTEEEEFRAGAHGFVMWSLSVVAGLLLIAAASGVTDSSLVSAVATRPVDQAANTAYWADMMFGPAPNTPQMMAAKGEARRILSMNAPGAVSDQDTGRLSQLVSGEDGISLPAATSRVTDTEARWAAAAHDARRTATVTALWTAIALLFGMIVAVAATIAARWEDDKIHFSWASRRRI